MTNRLHPVTISLTTPKRLSNRSLASFMKRLITIALLIAIVAVGAREALFWYEHVHEANARVGANFTVLASSVNGKLTKVHVKQGQQVSSGQLLATMDDREAQLSLQSLQAELARQKARQTETTAERAQFLAQLSDRIATARAESEALDLTYLTLKERLAIARKNVERNSTLESRSIVARQRVDDANDRLLEMTERISQMQSEMTRARMSVVELRGQRRREAVFASRLQTIEREMDKTRVELQIAQQRLVDMQIRSPIDGVLNKVHVNPGTYVEDGDPLLLLHDPADLWIEAHVAESNIRLIAVGQPVQVELDAYPFEHFSGTVTAIGAVTVGQISADSDNGGAERIPVEIALTPINKPVWPGMRAAVNITVRDISTALEP